MEPGNRHLTQVGADKLGEGLTATRSDYRYSVLDLKRGIAFKGATAEVSTANKHGHATPLLDIAPVHARRLVTLLIVQIIETLIPFALALTVRT